MPLYVERRAKSNSIGLAHAMTDFEYESLSPYNPRSLHVQNRQARALIEFALETARRYVPSESEPAEIERIANWYGTQFWDGMTINLAELFPSADSRRFWCRVFFDAAHHVLHNNLAKPESRFLHTRCICDLIVIGRMLQVAQREMDPEWKGLLPIDWRDEVTYDAAQSGDAI